MEAGVKRARARWSRTVLVCGKCSRKLDGGFGPKGDQPLAKALRKHLGMKKGPKAQAGIIETRCLDLCPKRAVAVVRGDRPAEWLVVPGGADLDAVARQLELPGAAPASDEARAARAPARAGA